MVASEVVFRILEYGLLLLMQQINIMGKFFLYLNLFFLLVNSPPLIQRRPLIYVKLRNKIP